MPQRARDRARDPRKRADRIEFGKAALLDGELKDRPFVTGDAFTVAGYGV